MGQELLILSIAVFGASVLQAATGIGFGVVAGPLLLIVLNDSAAIQVSVALNLLIAVILAPSLWRIADRKLLPSLLIGLAVGSPIGLVGDEQPEHVYRIMSENQVFIRENFSKYLTKF